jgi:signal transduction histidine kinase
MSRLPLRARMTIAFVACTALALAALSVFLHQRLAHELKASLQSGLRSRVGDLAGQIRRSNRPTLPGNALIERGDDLAQVLDGAGRVRSTSPGTRGRPLLSPAQTARAGRQVLVVDRAQGAEHDDDDVMLVAAPAGRFVAVVGTDLRPLDEALSSLDGLLLVGVPVALLIAGGAGYLVAGGGLRAIEKMRQRAEAIGTRDLAERLPVPPSRDEVRRLAETLNAMLGRLQSGVERERAFVADASHELRTPIARLKAELELASSERRTPTELRAAVRSSAAEADLLGRLAGDLLVLARADQGRLPVRLEPISLEPFLSDAAARSPTSTPVTVDCPTDVVVDADRVRLRQAIDNLLDNARRHGAEPVRIVVTRGRSEVRIHVCDGGDGIPAPLRPIAFDRFTRADAAREGGGVGLGLSMVAAVAAAHHGSVGIDDGSDGGAAVWFSLPVPSPAGP